MPNLSCIVPNCTSTSRNKDLKFHHIPFDAERRKQWIISFKRPDLINLSPRVLRNKFVCSIHFNKSMYKKENLKHSATPSINLTGDHQDSFTQTYESIKFIGPAEPSIVKTELTDLTKIEVTTSYTQTEEFMFNAYCKPKVKQENVYTDTQFEENHMQCNELKIKNETKTKENKTVSADEKTDEMKQTSTDSEQEDEASEMSIDEFLELNKEIVKELGRILKTKDIPQPPIQNPIGLRAMDKEVQTDDVIVYDIPKNNMCFQQCLRCGLNKNMLKPIKPDHRITLEEFEAACERFLSPMFCATVQTQIKLDRLTDKNTDPNMKKQIMSGLSVPSSK